jgi:hypothetical protein
MSVDPSDLSDFKIKHYLPAAGGEMRHTSTQPKEGHSAVIKPKTESHRGKCALFGSSIRMQD